jgi:hypothetical protein
MPLDLLVERTKGEWVACDTKAVMLPAGGCSGESPSSLGYGSVTYRLPLVEKNIVVVLDPFLPIH